MNSFDFEKDVLNHESVKSLHAKAAAFALMASNAETREELSEAMNAFDAANAEFDAAVVARMNELGVAC